LPQPARLEPASISYTVHSANIVYVSHFAVKMCGYIAMVYQVLTVFILEFGRLGYN